MKNVTDEFPVLCTPLWWKNVVAEWNKHPDARRMAGFGTASFAVSDWNHKPILLHWDEEGSAQIIEQEGSAVTHFSAPFSHWQEYVSGAFGAAEGVMKGKITLSGSSYRVLPFTSGFTLLAEVGRAVTNKSELVEVI